MASNLVIVESPAKAKTIKKFLGDDFEVASSYGHVRDLPQGNIAIDIENDFSPTYEISAEKKKIVGDLKKLAKDAQQVFLATDEDREGEAISWHLCHALGIAPEKAHRITYTEVTEKAILNAVNQPRKIDINLVNAQQARRVIDRLVGYNLSPVLWKKVRLARSAGRVQSVAVRLIVEREREIQAFKSVSFYKVTAQFFVKDKNGQTSILKAELPGKFETEEEALKFLEKCKNAEFTVKDVEKKPGKKSPSQPFTTSTLQQEAGSKLGFSVSRTMLIAQKLYESGLITYMRTDSVNLAESAIGAAKNEIVNRYGEEYSKPRRYKTKSSGAQEAHEAIRPSYLDRKEVEREFDEVRLYELIWKRTMASQMADAKIERTIVKISISTTQEEFVAKGEVVLFDGFLKVYQESKDESEVENEEESGLLPPLSVGQLLKLKEMLSTQKFTKPAARFSEASLVRKLEELGIGRPSTYAPTIITIQKRSYVVKEGREGTERNYKVFTLKENEIRESQKTEIVGKEKAKLFPTDMGGLVNDFLLKNFKNIMDYSFTANIEKEFDEIAAGQIIWNEMIGNFYKPFYQNVENTTQNAERVTGERELGTDPKSGEKVIVRMGRYGPMAQIGQHDDENGKKPRYARLRNGQSLESIQLEEALELFKLPRILGELEGLEVKVNIGRFGPYVQHNKKFASIGKEKDVYTIKLDEAIELILEKRKADANKTINVFEAEDIHVLNGRYGPYIKQGRNNFRIPKDRVAQDLTLEDCKTIIENAPAKKGKGRRKKS